MGDIRGFNPVARWLVQGSVGLLVALGLVIFVSNSLATFWRSLGDSLEVYYPTYRDAVADDAVARGWIPSFVPASAVAIHEWHELDTNTQRLRFRVPSGEFVIPPGFEPIGDEHLGRSIFGWGVPDFWRSTDESVYAVYEGRTEEGSGKRPAFLAVEIAGEDIFYWDTGAAPAGLAVREEP